MEQKHAKEPDTNVTKVVLRKTVRMVLAEKPEIVWPTEAARLSPYEKEVASKLYGKYEKVLTTLFDQAKTVLPASCPVEQIEFLDSVIKRFLNPEHFIHKSGCIRVQGRLENLLLDLALFSKLENRGKGVIGAWDILCAKKI